MNSEIICKSRVKEEVLDCLAAELPTVIANAMIVPGGHLAMVKPEQIALEFIQASSRDTGPDIRIKVFARKNTPRELTEHERAQSILTKTISLVNQTGNDYSMDVRIYLMDIGTAEYTAGSN